MSDEQKDIDTKVSEIEDDSDMEIVKAAKEAETALNTAKGASIATQTQMSPNLADFFVVELNFSGLLKGVQKVEDRLLTKVFRLNKEQRNDMQYLRVKYYRMCDKLSIFRLNNKYVIPKRRIKEFEKSYGEIEKEFEQLRQEVFNTLTSDWPRIVGQLKMTHPTLSISDSEIEALKPADLNFVSMTYNIRTIQSMLNELSGMKDIFLSDEFKTGELANRMDAQRNDILSAVKGEYDNKLQELEGVIDKLKSAVGRKGKRYEKLKLHARELAEDAEDMAELMGEKDTMKTKLDAMKEMLVE